MTDTLKTRTFGQSDQGDASAKMIQNLVSHIVTARGGRKSDGNYKLYSMLAVYYIKRKIE